ncbi:MAG: hypothetical protein Q4D21_06210 [Phascolarctobacterium sp.]|nr:hypothetical protein [Phascolarctobacterium sp.]
MDTKNKIQFELDYIKYLGILLMVFVHTAETYGATENGIGFFFARVVTNFGAAQAFMISMGITLHYSRKQTPYDFMVTGIYLLFLNFFLNIFRFFLPAAYAYYATGDPACYADMTTIISNDIFAFAGLAMLLLAAFKHLNVKPVYIFVVSVLMSIIGSFLPLADYPSFALTSFVGYFVPATSDTVFPVMNWFIFPAFGYLLGEYYVKITDKPAFMKRIAVFCIPLAIVWGLLRYYEILPFKLAITEFASYYFVNTIDAFMNITVVMAALSFFYFLAQLIGTPAFIRYGSKHFSKYYAVSWSLIYVIFRIRQVNGTDELEGEAALWLTVLFTFVATALLVRIYVSFIDGYVTSLPATVRWGLLIVVVVASVSTYAETSKYITVFPTWHNEFHGMAKLG